MKAKQTGFTLIELVIVIVILGVLAATALPRFLDLTDEARVAAVKGLAGGVQASSSVARAACIMDTGCNTSASGQTVNLEGVIVQMDYGYPTSGTNGIIDAMDFQQGDFVYTPGNGRFTLSGLGGCYALYTPASGVATGAAVSISLTCS